MRNVLLKIEYDGTYFSGWARQPKIRTVQGELEKILSDLCCTSVELKGTGRTDAGVHAVGQCATFSGDFGIPTDRLARAANDILAENRFKGGVIRISEAVEVPEGFHAGFDAVGKTYTYMIRLAEEMSVFLSNYRYHIKKPLDIDKMQAAIMHFEGTHDFAAFMAAGGTPHKSTVRHIYSAQIAAFDRDESVTDIAISITGDGFLYNMVRIIVGTLVDVGLGRIAVKAVPDIIAGCDRQMAGHTAPPQGLYMKQVYFTKEALIAGANEAPTVLPQI